jgi:Ca2+-transporting ATPase
MEIRRLKNNQRLVEHFNEELIKFHGVQYVHPCPLSGRILVIFDEKRLSIDEMLSRILQMESSFGKATGKEQTLLIAEKEIATTIETEIYPLQEMESHIPEQSTAYSSTMESFTELAKDDKIPLFLALSIGGLTVLGTKRLLTGPSSMASLPLPFYLSGLVSVISGYPFIKRGFQSWCRGNKWNSDLILGTGALALALVRQNLVVLAGISILQYINWKRNESQSQPLKLSPEIRQYSTKAEKWGLLAAAATLTFTRNPLRGLAVLLAANPRPAILPAECAWNQAEMISVERNYFVPKDGSVSQLARTKTLLIEDSSSLFKVDLDSVQCVNNDNENEKVVCLAASLMEKSSHPWKEKVWKEAKKTCRTLRTAFHIEESQNGIKGKVNESWVYAGNLEFLQNCGIDCNQYSLEAKRQQRKGYSVLFVAKDEGKSKYCIGLLVKKQSVPSDYESMFRTLIEKDWNIVLLQNGVKAETSTFNKFGMNTDWLSLEPGDWVEKIAVMRQRGDEVLFVPCNIPTPAASYLLQRLQLPTLSLQQLRELPETLQYAEVMDRTLQNHLEVTKKWNLAGGVLAASGWVGAPFINLLSDALSLFFLSRTNRISQSTAPMDYSAVLNSSQEVAAAAEAVQLQEAAWHSTTWEHAIESFQSNHRRGLTHDQIESVRSRLGPNQLEGRKPTPWFVAYLGQFKEFSTLILLGTTVLSFFTGGVFDGIAMGAVLLANAAIGAYQESKAEKSVEALTRFQPSLSKVLRKSVRMEIPADQLVPGDIVFLEAGDRIPADIRLIEARNLEVNESALTGESLSVNKQETILTKDLSLSERSNMLYMGTDVCSGKGYGLVVQTGMGTELGRIMSLLKSDEKEITPLQEKVTAISKKFVKGALIAGGVVFIAGLLRGVPIPQMISTSVTLAASAIPEGLPVTITIALSAGIYRMIKKQALVRKLSALETLGRTTVICMDKTGTLTKNEMTVKAIATVDHLWSVTGNGYEPQGNILQQSKKADSLSLTSMTSNESLHDLGNAELDRILHIGLLCNNSQLEKKEEQWDIKGDPTEGALLTLAAKNGLWLRDLKQWHRRNEIPFDSTIGKMSVVCKDTTASEECYVYSKGALESILRHCSKYQTGGEVYPLTEEKKLAILEQNEKLASEALRVLGFAYRSLCGDEETQTGVDEKDMIFVGMVGMMDPPKQEIERIIQEAYSLGVKPVMITGDHPITAVAIGTQLGIYNGTQRVISGYELNRMTDEQLLDSVEQVSIFARVTPEQKLRIVNALQNRGHIVAMTGDGINDAPAIKQADVGIAMGQRGAEVTKQTADIILTEDHFGSIVDGVKEGRTIISNIRKALGCLLTGNLAEIIVTSASVIVGLPIPLVPIQILLMNLLTDALPAMVLAINPGNKTKLKQRVEIADKELYQKVVTKGLLLGAGSLGLFAFSLFRGAPLPVARSVTFATLVVGQLMQTFFWRQEGSEETVREWSKDRFFMGSLAISLLALLTAIYVPPVAQFFHTAPIALHQWLPIIGAAGSVSLLSKPILSFLMNKEKGIDRPAFEKFQTATAASA